MLSDLMGSEVAVDCSINATTMSQDFPETGEAPASKLNTAEVSTSVTVASSSTVPRHPSVDTKDRKAREASGEKQSGSPVRDRNSQCMDPIDLSNDFVHTRRRSTGSSSELRSQFSAELPNLPNLRDLALSSGLAPRMRRGLLFRSARHFATSVDSLKATLCDCLDIRTLIDLRSKDLGAGSDEEISRQLAKELFALQPTRGAHDDVSPRGRRASRSALGRGADRSRGAPVTSSQTLLTPSSSPGASKPFLHGRRHSALAMFPTGSSISPPSQAALSSLPGEASRRVGGELAHVPRFQLADLERKRTSAISDVRGAHETASSEVQHNCGEINKMGPAVRASAASQTFKPPERGRRVSIALNPLPVEATVSPTPPPLSPVLSSKRRFSTFETDKLPINDVRRTAQYMNERKFRKLFLVDILDTPQAKKRINEAVMGSYAMPIIAACRLADKISGSTLAPFFFCKFLMSTQNLIDSYKDMLSYCGKSFCNCLKVICTEPSPILFHCTLGKDRTGLVAMLVLSVLGASDQAIAYDFSLTDHAPAEYLRFRHHFIVEQSGLAEKFERAPATVMLETLNYIRDNWGSVDNYLDKIGFGVDWRDLMRRKFLVPQGKDGDQADRRASATASSSTNAIKTNIPRPTAPVKRVAFVDGPSSAGEGNTAPDEGETTCVLAGEAVEN